MQADFGQIADMMTGILAGILPPLPVFLAFAGATLALNLTPGADIAYILARTSAQGRNAGFVSAVGISTGAFIHTGLAAAGITVMVMASEIAFMTVKLAGAAYLAWLAFQMLRGSFLNRNGQTLPQAEPATLKRRPMARVFTQAVMVNLMNPKVALFVIAFFPQFTNPARGPVWAQIMVLGLWFALSSIFVNGGVAVLAAHAGRKVAAGGAVARWAKRLAGLTLGALAVRMALATRS